MTFSWETKWYEIACSCGTHFAIPSTTDDTFRRSGKTFYCPNGHILSYTVGLTADQKKLQEQQAARERAEAETRRVQAALNEQRHATLVAQRKLSAEKGQRTKMLRRIAAGVCTCCNRTFADLAAHMQTKHPEVQIEAGRVQRQIA